jgi:proline iminopeptidase
MRRARHLFAMDSPRERFLAYRGALPRPPRLAARTMRARGLDFAVFTTPAVPDAVPLVCVNGGLLFDHALLWPALAPLAAARQLVLYDQRGRGRSQPPPGARAARIEHDAGDLGALREALGVDRWDVLGHSWGGGIALLGAAADPAGTRRLVTVDAVGPTSRWVRDLHPRALARLDADQGAALAAYPHEALFVDDPAVHAAYTRALYPAWFASRDLAALFTPPRTASRTGAAVLARLRRDGYDWTAQLADLSAPTLVIHGEDDLLPPAEAEALVALLPRARLALVPGAGHMPFWEAPHTFFPLVERFLLE